MIINYPLIRCVGLGVVFDKRFNIKLATAAPGTGSCATHDLLKVRRFLDGLANLAPSEERTVAEDFVRVVHGRADWGYLQVMLELWKQLGTFINSLTKPVGSAQKRLG